MTHYYHINSLYINSHETFMYAIIGCIYTEMLEGKKLKDGDFTKLAEALSNFARCIREIFVAYRDPNNGFLGCYDILDSCYRASSYNKLQGFTDELVKFVDDQIVVIFDGGTVEDYMGFLPDFHGKIEVR